MTPVVARYLVHLPSQSQESNKAGKRHACYPRAREKMIAQQRKTLKVEREATSKQVYDLTLLKAISKESGR